MCKRNFTTSRQGMKGEGGEKEGLGHEHEEGAGQRDKMGVLKGRGESGGGGRVRPPLVSAHLSDRPLGKRAVCSMQAGAK